LYVFEIIEFVLQKSSKSYEKSCGLDCYKNYHN
jgi:hypothetical protein